MGPLEGIKVLDLTSMVSGPVAAMMLGDQGADVIKVEPIHGEQLRHLGETHNGLNPGFYSCNRNKRSLAVDLKTELGKQILWDLIKDADVLLQNFRPGAMRRMGFPEEEVRKVNRGIIFVSISGFGEKGPYAHKRVYDPIVQALSCATDIQADRKTQRPNMFRIILADKVSALTAAQAVSSALFHRERHGEGQHIKISMLEATIAFLWPEGMGGLVFADQEMDIKRTYSSIDLIYETQDGYMTISIISDKEWQAVCSALDREDLIDDERFSTALARRKNAELRREVIAAEVSKRATGELLEKLDAADVPCAPLLDRKDLLDHPQIVESGTILREIQEGFGEVRQARPAARFGETPASVRTPAPQLGEHTVIVLQSLGYDQKRCDKLLEGKVVLQSP
ncbi:MAG: CoA transferase [Gammaproteobacteria bacterium]|jgi:crotonobetainyl-CoA:carnitine CoA-transferase CaiB-like acyl-CoA transferase|nr:CoA transferase [Pseudomonadales bacterium]GIT22295.1 MAG: CoA transferase [Gammaproteobacteria bacterium]|tara:strand:- start:1087 stop:2274 length:1188 start_codon:yes stop_codon:yes gene_type:complete